MPNVRLFTVKGRVQGVFYRASTAEQGNRLGLTGWVRNLPDGKVEAVAEGKRPVLEQLVAWCWDGPPSARVDQVMNDWQSATGEFERFSVRR